MAADDSTAAGQSDRSTGGVGPAASSPALAGLARRSILVSALIGLAALVATGFALMQLRAHNLETSLRNLQHVAYGVAEQTSREIVEADRNLMRLLESATLRPQMLDDREQRERVLPRNVVSIAQVAAIAYVESTGERHYYDDGGSSALATAFPATELEDGLTVIAGPGGEPTGLYLSRAVAMPDDANGGALVMRLSERHFGDLFNVWRGRSAVKISLTTRENRALLQHPDAPVLPAGAQTRAETRDATPVPAPGMRYKNPDDGMHYLVVSQTVSDYPLLVHTAVSEAEALAEWTAQGAILVGAVVSLVLIMLVMARRHAAELSRRAAAINQMESLQSALAVEEALLRTETRIATVLSSAASMERMAGEVVATLCGLGFAYGHWAVRDPLTREWRVWGQWRAPGIDAARVAPLAEGLTGTAPQGVASRAWNSGEVLWRTDLQARADLPRPQAAVTAGFRSHVAVPVRAGGEAVAVIELFSMNRNPRSELLENALRSIGLQVGQVLSRLEAEEQLRKIVRTVPSAVFQARVGERNTVALTFMSAQVETLWGVSASAVLARPRQVLWKIPPAYRRDLLRALSRAVMRASGWDVTVPIMQGDGLRWLRVHAAPAYKKGEAPVWDGIISDVTDQKRAEQQVVRLNLDLERRVEERTQQLAAVNKELEAFSESVSHDLRAPLRGMRSYAEMLRQSELVSGEAHTMVERIVSQGVQMENLIEALLELSQISRHELRRADCDMSATARAILEDLQAREPGRSVHWTVQRGIRAYADPRLMRVLFENLLANAWKFTRNQEHPVIEVGTLPDAARTVFVRDNGAGFDPAYADKLFQPFQRLHPASQFEGTGIGLATVQRIVRRHGWRLWAESRPGEGATFFFEISPESPPN